MTTIKRYLYGIFDKITLLLMTQVAVISYILGIIGGLLIITAFYNYGLIWGGLTTAASVFVFQIYYKKHGKQPDMVIYATEDQFGNNKDFSTKIQESIGAAIEKAKVSEHKEN